ncbi:YdgA family protein [Pseudomonadota bacterium]
MKKVFIILIILAAFVGGVAAGEYWFGKKAKEAFNQILKDLADDKTILIRQHNYQRGVISSTATTVADTASGNLRINVKNKLHHGPFPLEELLAGNFELNPVLAKIVSRAEVVNKAAKQKKPAVINFITTIAFNGNQSTVVNAPPGSHKTAEGTMINWQAVTGRIESGSNNGGAKGVFSLPKLVVKSHRGESTSGPVNIRYNIKNNNLGLSLGNASVELTKLNIAGVKGSQPVDISKLQLTSSLDVKRGLLNYAMGLKTKRINYDQETYGPGDFRLVIKGVDAKAIANLQKTALGGGSGKAKNSPQVGPAFLELLGTFGKSKPVIETKMSLKTPDGEMQGTGKAMLKGNLGGAAANPLALLTALNVQGVVTLPEKLVISTAAFQVRNELKAMANDGKIPALDVEQEAKIVNQAVAGRVSKWVSENWLEVKGNNLYQMSARYNQDGLSFNGQPVNILQGLLPGG